MPRWNSTTLKPSIPNEIKPKRKYTRRRSLVSSNPPLPLARHGLIPSILREMERWLEASTDRTFIEKVVAALEGEHVVERVRDALDRVKFNAAAVEDFDSRRFYHLANLLLQEIGSVIDGEAERMEMDIEEAGMMVERNWSECRLAMLV